VGQTCAGDRRGHVRKIKAYADDLITLPQTTAITGVPRYIFRQLVKQGFCREILGMTTGGTGGRDIWLQRLENSLIALDRASGATADTRTLNGYAKRRGISEGEVLASTLRGELAPAIVDKSRTGLLYY
jgi:hypothetical protein